MAMPVIFHQGGVCGVLLFINKKTPYKIKSGEPRWFNEADELLGHLGSYLFSTISTLEDNHKVLQIERLAVT